MRPLLATLALACVVAVTPWLPRHVIIRDLPDLSDLSIVVEPDPVNFAAEQIVPGTFVARLPLPRHRPRVAGGDLDPARVLLAEASKWINAGPRALGVRLDLWCAAAVNKILANIGLPGTGSDAAASFDDYGRRLAAPKPGAIAVGRRYHRGRLVGGHVGIVQAVEGNRVILISPNGAGNRVRLQTYSATRFYTFRDPTL